MAKKKSAKSGGKLKCDICGKTFGMPAHLGRHKSTIHGVASKASKKKKVKKARGKKATKKAVGKAAKRTPSGKRGPGRPPGIASKFGLRNLTLDELAALIEAARAEAGRRLNDYRDLLK